MHLGPAVEELAAQNMGMQGPVHDCIFKAVGAVLNVLFQDQILGVFSAPPFLATATFPRMCYDRLIETKTTLHDAYFIF